ncbi:hypothetical protein HYQ46_002664 [Verticillium longisporum]|nr:hypothetical protein HYQ46_002664 [Verticillium longisporum]
MAGLESRDLAGVSSALIRTVKQLAAANGMQSTHPSFARCVLLTRPPFSPPSVSISVSSTGVPEVLDL